MKSTGLAGSVGVVVSAIGCAGCFPALGSLGAAIGLGFLSSFEGVFINTLLPLFAVIALFAGLAGWYQHRVHIRGILSVLGPTLVLLVLYPLWQYEWSTWVFYGGVLSMVVISVLDIVQPARTKSCRR
ncbi:organomercurial transporter MerC [Litorivivens sp.]|uniref:organomercurial transporter MerC n=2 Tax=Litorivivens sp. TaxID=2020868 RepID=UPI00356AE2D5